MLRGARRSGRAEDDELSRPFIPDSAPSRRTRALDL